MYDNEMRSCINTHYLLLGMSELSSPWGPWLTWNMVQGKLSNANPLPHFSSICWCVTTWWYLFSKFGLCHVVIKSLLRRPIYLRSVWMLSPLEWWWIKGHGVHSPVTRAIDTEISKCWVLASGENTLKHLVIWDLICVQTHLQKCVPLGVVLRQVSSGLQGARWKSII